MTSSASNPGACCDRDASRPSAVPRTSPHWDTRHGSLVPLGVSWIESEEAYNFTLYSRHATRVSLLLYRDGDGGLTLSHEIDLDHLEHKSGPVWHCRVPLADLGGARYYAWRVAGPFSDDTSAWHAFDPDKTLLDPYAQAVFLPPAFDRRAASQRGSNEGRAPLGLIDACRCGFDWTGDRPVRHDSDLVIYEMHVRGFTRHPSSQVHADRRGTFSGVIDRIPYLKDLGVTAVELMPVFQFDPQEDQYWGYMPLNFFAPHHAYSVSPSACMQHLEFRDMVAALHDAGIEVILDVVYNHTCEGDQTGPCYSFKGIDNKTYYLLTGNPAAPYANFSGTGNTLRTAHRAVRRLIMDSLRFWVREMHVDGFRFDLASIFTRDTDGSLDLTDPPIFDQIAGDPDLRRVRLIAEPWDAAGLQQLGRRFPGVQWMQWNGRYRDAIQRFVRGDAGLVSEIMTRLYGSADLFPDSVPHAFHPFQSVNYVTSHDGFPLYDLVSYNNKRNWANGHGNSDGPNDFSWNCGWEGDDGVPGEVMRLRKQQAKNCFCLLMLSNGTPMFRMGDEFLQTQGGNNNPYNQDNDTTWLDWRRLELHGDVHRFCKRMIAFRKAHRSIARFRFWRDDVQWFGPDGPVDLGNESRALGFALTGSTVDDDDLCVLVNASDHIVEFHLPNAVHGKWVLAVDTSLPSPKDICDVKVERAAVASSIYEVAPRSVAVLVGPRNR